MKPADSAIKLPDKAIKAWRVYNSIWCFFIWCVPLFFWVMHLIGTEESMWLTWGVTFGAIVLSLLLLIVIPKIRWKQWYYVVDEDAVELQKGIIILQQTLVPLNRVQHVDTRQGPILDSYKLADVIISTAATKHKIPALDIETAEAVRKQITKFARKARRDV